MGLFGKKNSEEEKVVKGGGLVQSVSKNDTELQDLLREFRDMRNSVGADSHKEEEPEMIYEEEIEDGEEYEVSTSESESIEDFLNSGEEIEEESVAEEEIEEVDEDEEELDEEIIEEVVDEEDFDEVEEIDEEIIEEDMEEILDEEDIVEDSEEVIEEEISEDDVHEEPIEVEVNINEMPEESVAEEIADEVDDWAEESQQEVPAVTSEEIDKKFDEKFDEFERRLMDKLMKQFASMQMVQPKEVPTEDKPATKVTDLMEEELEVKTVGGKLVINDFVFSGEVVMFTPLESVKKATWEEVVRRKGHCTYHLTNSGNGGWFIKKSNAPNPYAYIEKKEEAEELAKVYAMREKAELKIHNAKGVIEKSLSFGREKLRG